MKAPVTEIQRFSLNDGDGIRTTVFFKGCNMSCRWCHNPETISKAPELMHYSSKCIGCGKCFDICPNNAHILKDGVHTIDSSRCTSCGKCADICYAKALVMCGKEKTVEEIMFEVRQDIEYYKSSGGGVTLSGGEVLCNREFASALTDACHNESIPVAVETNLCFPYKDVLPLLEKCDLIMCDIKIFDDNEHKAHTGVSNKLILENIKHIDTLGIPIIIRTPLIPEATDSAENITAIAEYIKDMKKLRRYELLRFNPLGEAKYKALGKENKYEACRKNDESNIREIITSLDSCGISYKII